MNQVMCIGKAMISQPMAGKTDEEIVVTRERATYALHQMNYEVVNTLFSDEWAKNEASNGDYTKSPLWFLAKSLEAMSRCNAVYFCKGWEQFRGCRIEHDAAAAYGLEIIYEETSMEERPRIYVSTFPHNMQAWYEEKLTKALLALFRLKLGDDCLPDYIDKKVYAEEMLDNAIVYVQTVLDMSVGV